MYGGLKHNNMMMKEISCLSILIYAGIYAATISSALASLVGAPRILQAVARDNLFPFLSYFSTGYGSSDEPLRAYVLTMIIAGLFGILVPITLKKSNFRVPKSTIYEI